MLSVFVYSIYVLYWRLGCYYLVFEQQQQVISCLQISLMNFKDYNLNYRINIYLKAFTKYTKF